MKMKLEIEDEEFNAIYPEEIKNLSNRHWTPIAVAKQAAEFLVYSPGVKVLDIGSGAGKFCLVGSAYTDGHFTGVEQRKNLYQLSNRIIKSHNLQNVEFIHSNITQINFNKFKAIYFYNPFHENIEQSAKIDKKIKLSTELYDLYFLYVKEQLNEMPIGTRLATYWASLFQIPATYNMVATSFDDKLLMWVKTF